MSKKKKPKETIPTTYEGLEVWASRWYGTVSNFAEMATQAIAERGGHCLGCTRKSTLTALKPKRCSGPLGPQNLSVRVACTIDLFRKYPFQNSDVKSDQCPSLRRHLRLHENMEVPA